MLVIRSDSNMGGTAQQAWDASRTDIRLRLVRALGESLVVVDQKSREILSIAGLVSIAMGSAPGLLTLVGEVDGENPALGAMPDCPIPNRSIAYVREGNLTLTPRCEARWRRRLGRPMDIITGEQLP